MEQERAGSITLAQKLDRLFRTRLSPRGKEYSYAEVAMRIGEQGGPPISGNYIWELRTGRADNPRKQHVEALATFFGVSPAYFFDGEAAALLHAQLELLAAMRDANVRGIATRAAGLSPQSLRAIAQIIEQARYIEGLPDGEPADRPRPDGSTSQGNGPEQEQQR